MSKGHLQALQDTLLEPLRKHKVAVTIFLANGARPQGTVAGFDNYALLLGRDQQSQLGYKHAISTILPGQPVQIGPSEEHEARKSLSPAWSRIRTKPRFGSGPRRPGMWSG